MKNKLIALALTLVMVVGLMPARAFAAEKTPISSIDLTGLGLEDNNGWLGKTAAEAISGITGYSGFASQHVSCVSAQIMDMVNPALKTNTDPLVANTQYMLAIILKANDGYYFKNNKVDYKPGDPTPSVEYLGTVVPDPFMSIAALGSYMFDIDDIQEGLPGQKSVGYKAEANQEDGIYLMVGYMITPTAQKKEYQGNKTASGVIKEAQGEMVSITLPAIPEGAAYGKPEKANEADKFTLTEVRNGAVLASSGGLPADAKTLKFQVPVTGSTEYNDYFITVTLDVEHDVAPTGDTNTVFIYALIMAAAAAGFCVVFCKKRNR